MRESIPKAHSYNGRQSRSRNTRSFLLASTALSLAAGTACAQIDMTTTQFLNTIGVNTHIATGVADYGSAATDLTDLQYLGAANVRDGYNPSNESVYTALGQAGIKFDLETYAGGSVTTSSLQSELSSFNQLNSAAPGMVAALEGPNEINNWPVTYNGATSLNSAVAYQQDLYSLTHADSSLPGVQVYYFTGYGMGGNAQGPNPAATPGLADFDTAHPYPQNGMPPLEGVANTSSALNPLRSDALTNEAPSSTGPAVYTETGYSMTASGNTDAAIGDVELLLDDAQQGIAKTYLYELEQEAAGAGDGSSGGLGLFNGTVPTPAATAIHNLTSILQNSAAAASAASTAAGYSVAGLPASTGHSMEFAGANGTSYIAIWNENWSGATTPVTVSLNTAAPVSVYDPISGSTATRTANTSSLSLNLTADPVIIEVNGPATPVAAPAAASAAAASGSPPPSAASAAAASGGPPSATNPVVPFTSACGNTVPNYAASAGGFGTLDGQIYSPNGDPFIARGVNVMYGNGNPSAAQLQADFPGINYVRLAIYNYDSPAALTAYVNDLTSHGIVVELENHNNGAGNAGGNQGTIFTGAALAQEQAWYSAVAAAFKTNPYVWFGTNNEPSEVNANGQTDPAALSAWQQQTYQTIRSAGNNSPVLLEANSWGPGKTNAGYTASDYAGMTNVIWDLHYYGWLSGYSTNQSTVTSTLAGMIADTAAIQSADGKIPVLIGEYGNSTTGQAIDANGNQVVTAVQQSGAGSAAWAWGSGNPGDGLTNGNGGVSAYGQQVAAFTAGSGAAGCAQSPIPSPAPAPAPASHGAVAPPAPGTPNATGQTPASTDVVSPGQGSATDAQGNTYAITADGSILENGNTWLPGGGGTSQLVIVNGVIYGKDNGSGPVNPGGWFTFSGGYWTPSSPPPLTAGPAIQAAPLAAQPETAPPLAPASTAVTAPSLIPASTVQTAPPLAASPMSINQVAALAAGGN
jgi:hypothetical protein